MEPPPKVPEERYRLDTLYSLGLLDTPPEERFDRITRIARRVLDVPGSMITLIDEQRLWVKSRSGIELEEMPRELSFCAHAIHDDDILVVADAARDGRFADNPYVVNEPGIRAYAGCPLAAGNGNRMGTLCVCDDQPRHFSGDDEVLLRDLANIAERELEGPRSGTLDTLTGVSDSQTFYSLARHMLTFCERMEYPATLVFFQLGEADIQSPLHGHAQADRILMNFADILLSTSRESDVRGRVDTNEFALLLANCDKSRVDTVLDRVNEALAEYRHMDRPNQAPRVYAAAVEYQPDRHEDVKTLVDEASWKLHRDLYPGQEKDKSNIKPVY